MVNIRIWSAMALLLTLVSCIGTSPEDKLRADQGDDDDGDEEHRPGQPCLVCHSSDYSPGGDVFVLAGTIYLFASDDDDNGLEGALVDVIDAQGRSFTAETNKVGNFMVEVENGLSSPRQRKKGKLKIGFEPEFPLTVAVRHGDLTQEMESTIGRDGSCAGCHRGSEATAERVEKVWMEEEL